MTAAGANCGFSRSAVRYSISASPVCPRRAKKFPSDACASGRSALTRWLPRRESASRIGASNLAASPALSEARVIYFRFGFALELDLPTLSTYRYRNDKAPRNRRRVRNTMSACALIRSTSHCHFRRSAFPMQRAEATPARSPDERLQHPTSVQNEIPKRKDRTLPCRPRN